MSTTSDLLSKREYATVTGPDGNVVYTMIPTVPETNYPPYSPAAPNNGPYFIPIEALTLHDGLTNGQIVGIVVSSLALAILISYVGWVVYKHRQHKNMGQYPEPKGPGKLAGLKKLFERRGGGQGDLEKGCSGRSTPVGRGHPGTDETVIGDHHGDRSM